MLYAGVKALLQYTEGEMDCVGLKLLDHYEADVERVFKAMQNAALAAVQEKK